MKKKQNLATQYNGKAQKFLSLTGPMNEKSAKDLFGILFKYLNKSMKNLMELGCGGGEELLQFEKLGYSCTGIDASSEMCEAARRLSKNLTIYQKDFTKPLRLKKNKYDMVFSKWAIQTALDIEPVYRNIQKVLAPNGIFLFLTVHPIRQFIEKRKSPKNYFKKEIVFSKIFDKSITVEEPSHTMEEYLSPFFFKHFELLEIKEGFEFPAAEQIGGDTYPTHLVIVARKK
jgi:SAM-dependent methyltransferase